MYDPTIEYEMGNLIREYWLVNDDTTTPDNVWDAFKEYIRGCYQSSSSRARRDAANTLKEAETKAQALESQYVLISNPITYQDMQVAYYEVMLFRVVKANINWSKQSVSLSKGRRRVGFWHGYLRSDRLWLL